MTFPPFAWPPRSVAPASSGEIIIPNSNSPSNATFLGAANVYPPGWNVYCEAGGGGNVFGPTIVQAAGAPFAPLIVHAPQVALGNDASRIGFDCNSRKPGWFAYQAPLDSTTRFLTGTRMLSDLPAEFTLIAKFTMIDLDGAGAANLDGGLYWGCFSDNGGLPGTMINGVTRRVMIRLGPNTGSGSWELSFHASDGTSSTSLSRAISVNANLHVLGGYLRIDRYQNVLYAYLGNAFGSWSWIATVLGAPAGASVPLRWWGFAHIQRSAHSWVGFNWMRRFENGNAVL